MTLATANSKLSLAASAIWNIAEHEMQEYQMDGSGDCGPMIARHLNNARYDAVREHGFTPGEYNAALRERLAPDYPRMSYRIYGLLSVLEVEACPECGGAIDEREFPTRQYGGGFDTTVACRSCGFKEVYV